MKNLLLLLLLTPLLSVAQIYNFNTSVSNITEANGSVALYTHPSQGNTMEVQTVTSGSTAVFDMDSFSSSSDYVVTWKETYSSSRRDGFILRGNGSNSITQGLKQGYLFQVNSNLGDCRIYLSNASGFALLNSASLAASGIDTPRWYRASANGSNLTLDYSNDGVTFTNLMTHSDGTYLSGTTQYTIGYNNGVGAMYVDDITFTSNTSTANSIIINNISPYQIFQRDNAGIATILVEGTYTGTPTNIEARWNGSSTWTTLTIDSSGSGTFSGNLLNQLQGQGLLEARFTNDNGTLNSIANVGIGDIFIIAGQSNSSGRGNTLNNYSHGNLKSTRFGNNDIWSELEDPVDSSPGQIDAVSADGIAKGSPWPLVATSIMASQNIPVAFVPTAKGGTKISQWQPGANHANASTLYGSMSRRITAIGGNAKAILFFQGETDSDKGTSQTAYETGLNTFINTAESDFTGLKTMVGQIGYSEENTDFVRAAQINVLQTNSNAILGPVTYDIDLSDEGGDRLHFKSDADIAEFARRWYKAIETAFYGGTNGYGPIADKDNITYNEAANKITIPFTSNTTPVISALSNVVSDSFDLKNNNVTVPISSVSIVGNTIELTPTTPLNIAQTVTISYASINDGVNAAIYDNENFPAENFYNFYLAGTSSVSEFLLEAECGMVGSLWETLKSTNAGGGEYVKIKNGYNSGTNAPTNTDGHLTYQFNVNASDNYNVWARVITPNHTDDSFWLKVDGGSWVAWNGIGPHTNWGWEQFNTFNLATGPHTLTIAYREDGAELDKLYIGKNIPSGSAGSANNCSTANIKLDANGLENKTFEVKLFPNPAKETITIDLGRVLNTNLGLTVYDITGRVLLKKEITSGIYNIDLQSIESGTYFMQLQSNEINVTKTFVKIN